MFIRKICWLRIKKVKKGCLYLKEYFFKKFNKNTKSNLPPLWDQIVKFSLKESNQSKKEEINMSLFSSRENKGYCVHQVLEWEIVGLAWSYFLAPITYIYQAQGSLEDVWEEGYLIVSTSKETKLSKTEVFKRDITR